MQALCPISGLVLLHRFYLFKLRHQSTNAKVGFDLFHASCECNCIWICFGVLSKSTRHFHTFTGQLTISLLTFSVSRLIDFPPPRECVGNTRNMPSWYEIWNHQTSVKLTDSITRQSWRPIASCWRFHSTLSCHLLHFVLSLMRLPLWQYNQFDTTDTTGLLCWMVAFLCSL